MNPNVRTAGMRIMEARAQLGIAGSTLYPQLQQATGEVLGVGEHRPSAADTTAVAFNTGLRISWEIDFWGKFRRSIEAADAGYWASIAQYDDLQVLMAAQVAGLYCSIRTIEARLTIARENAVLQKRSLEIAELLFKSGNDSELDVQQAKAQYLGTLSTIPGLQGSLRQTQNALSTLLARPPGPLPEMAAAQDQIPQAELAVIVDMPADLLRRRPDVQGRGNAAGRAVGVDRRERGRALSIDLAAGLGGAVGQLRGGIDARAELGHRADPRLEHLRPRPAHATRCCSRTRASSSSTSSTRTRCCAPRARSTTRPSVLPRPVSRSPSSSMP